MMKYEKYKASGIEWLGDIPTQWKIKRVKDLGVYQSGEYINANEFDEENPYPVYGGNSFRGYANKYNTEGDYVLIGRQGALCGNINYGSGKFWATEHCVVVYHKRKINVKWLGELLRVMNLNQYATSTAQPGLSVEKIKRLELPVPPPQEQTAIAQYLDTKTQAIDKKINLLTKKAETYKELRKSIINEAVTKGLNPDLWDLKINRISEKENQANPIIKKIKVQTKDGGIEWIGKIPEHWGVKRFKDVVSKYTTGGTPPTANTGYFNGNNTWICISDISEEKYISNSKIKLTSEAIKEANILKTPKGSLLYSFKLSIGKMAFVTKDVYTNEAILSIFPNKNIDLEYYYFMLPMFMYLAATENIYGAKMLNQKLIASAFILHPPKEEQTAIANYLDEKTQKIDAIVTNINRQIETLKELRKTLINDVVTGKIKVSEPLIKND